MSIESLKKAQEVMRQRREDGIVTVRLDPIQKAKENPKSLRLAINAKCYECCDGSRAEIRNCSAHGCPLRNLRPYQSDDSDSEEE